MNRQLRERDGELLGRLVDQMLPSSHGDNALFALGEMALERGHPRPPAVTGSSFTRDCVGRRAIGDCHRFALRGVDLVEAWPQIRDRIESTRRSTDAYPDSEFEWSDAWARLVLVSILEGTPCARFELDLLRRLLLDARGGWREEKSRTWPRWKRCSPRARVGRQGATQAIGRHSPGTLHETAVPSNPLTLHCVPSGPLP